MRGPGGTGTYRATRGEAVENMEEAERKGRMRQDSVGSPWVRTVLRIFITVSSGISSFTPLAP